MTITAEETPHPQGADDRDKHNEPSTGGSSGQRKKAPSRSTDKLSDRETGHPTGDRNRISTKPQRMARFDENAQE